MTGGKEPQATEANREGWPRKTGGLPAADLAKAMRGEWHAMMEQFLSPVLVDERNPNRPPDAEKLARAMTGAMRDQVEAIRQSDFAELHDHEDMPSPEHYPELSERSRGIMGMFFVGAPSWGKGFVRAARISVRNQVALELLVLERAGTELSRETMAGLRPDPLNGRPFSWDAGARRIGFGDGDRPEELQLPW